MKIKAVVAVAMVVAGLASISGCAHMGKGDVRDLNMANSSDPVDAVYVAKVDAAAQANGVRVVWVNPPDKAHSR